MTLDLTDEEAAALARHLRRAIDEARYPYSAALQPDQSDPREAGAARRREPDSLPPLNPAWGCVLGEASGDGEVSYRLSIKTRMGDRIMARRLSLALIFNFGPLS
jgi:hypothetical protein